MGLEPSQRYIDQLEIVKEVIGKVAMNFYHGESCPAYCDPNVKRRKCYCEPQCWRRYIDLATSIFKEVIMPRKSHL